MAKEKKLAKNRRTILLVDDEKDLIDTVRLKLESDGFKVREAYDGTSALEEVKKAPPDLILLDVMMPNLNGYEVCRRLKQDPKTQNIPIVMLSAKVQKFDQEMGKESGANEYIIKPFDFNDLIQKIKSYLEQ